VSPRAGWTERVEEKSFQNIGYCIFQLASARNLQPVILQIKEQEAFEV
jgi:hypothetical protein